jgi:tetratricopeptide (TPR) repeat protein
MTTKSLALGAAMVLAAYAAAADLPAQSGPEPATDIGQTVRRAEVFAARQSWDAAIDAYREAIAASPKDAVLHNRLGICYQRAGEPKQARKAYKKAIELRKDYAEAWNNLATLEHSQGKLAQAVSDYTRAIELKPSDGIFHKNLGVAWLARGDVEKALAAWNEAYRIDPASLDSEGVPVPAAGLSLARQYYLYAKVLAARGESEKALGFLARARTQGFNDFGKVERDKDFAKIVADPRYAALK